MRNAILIVCAALLTLGCGKKESTEKSPEKKTAEGSKADEPKVEDNGPLRLVCGRKESLVGKIVEAFEKDTGIDVEVDYGKTPQLAMTLMTEGKDSPGDLFYAQESGYLSTMAKAGILAELPAELLEPVREEMKGGQKHWLAVSGRARVMVYDPNKIAADALPNSLEDLTGEAWKGKLGWAPTNGSFQAHVSALRHTWGEEETEKWLAAIKANETRTAKNNSSLVKDVARGAIEAALVNHYYSHKLGLTDKVKTHSFGVDDGSNVVMISGAGILAHSKRQDKAKKFLEYLLSEKAQKIFSQANYEYPARAGLVVHQNVAPMNTLKMTRVQQDHLTDVGATLKMLQKLGLN